MDKNEFEKRFNAAYARAIDSDFIETTCKGISKSEDHAAALIQAFLIIHERVLRAELEEFLVNSGE